jgi:NADPH:quinone reductase-like Zn-dependent oxidoreductase
MDCYTVERVGELSSFVVQHSETVPTPQAHHVLLRIKYCGLNPVDAKLALGRLTPDPPRILGHECVATVVAVGAQTRRCKVGDRVAAYLAQQAGGLATHVIVHENLLTVLPVHTPDATDAQWACTMLAACTALECLQRSVLQQNANCCVTGAAGGVGWFLVQLLRREPKVSRVQCVVSSAASRQHLIDALNFSPDDVFLVPRGQDSYGSATLGHAVDVAYDLVGGPSKLLCLRNIGFGGQVVTICEEPDAQSVPELNVFAARSSALFQKSASLSFVFLGARALFGKEVDLQYYAPMLDHIRDLIVEGHLVAPMTTELERGWEKGPAQLEVGLGLLRDGRANGKLAVPIP